MGIGFQENNEPHYRNNSGIGKDGWTALEIRGREFYGKVEESDTDNVYLLPYIKRTIEKDPDEQITYPIYKIIEKGNCRRIPKSIIESWVPSSRKEAENYCERVNEDVQIDLMKKEYDRSDLSSKLNEEQKKSKRIVIASKNIDINKVKKSLGR